MLLGGCVKFKRRCSLEPWEQRSPWREGPWRAPAFKGQEEELAKELGGSLAEREVHRRGNQCFKVKDVVRTFECGWEAEKMLFQAVQCID